MKINANTELFKKALAAAAAFCSARSTMPILANVRLGADFGSLVISATNLTAGATIGMPCAVQEPGVTTVNAGDILGIISTLEAEFVTIETDQAGTNLQITCPGYKGKLPTIAASEFPLIKSEMPETKFAVPTAQFIAALNAVTLTASKDDSRPVLTGIEFTMTADCIQMAATDGYRLTVDRIEAGTGIPEKTTLVVPASTARECVRTGDAVPLVRAHRDRDRNNRYVSERRPDRGRHAGSARARRRTLSDCADAPRLHQRARRVAGGGHG